jgi:hypothetical protein
MKRIISVIAILTLLILNGCAATNRPDQDLTVVAIKSAALMAGNHFGKQYPELIAPALRFSESFEAGEVTADQINDGLKTLAGLNVDPAIIEEILLLAEAMGIELQNGKVLTLAGVDERYINAAITGFFRGIALSCPTCGG